MELRSRTWFGKKDKMGFIYRSWMKNQGFPEDLFDGRPVIGICNTWSELTPCNAHLRDFAEKVKRGVYEAGGFPLEFPIMSLGETLLKPTAMLFRNLASMDAEESIRGNPLDGVVLLTGCDKTTPSTLMGAASVDLPTLVVPGGPMLNGKWKGHDIGSGTHVWKFDEDRKTGRVSEADLLLAESCMSRSQGHCMTMGTASTMACMVESLGLTLPGAAAIPAVDSRKKTLAQLSGRRIVEMVKEDLRLSKILTRTAFENAIKVNAAVGGSTNFIIHLTAIAGRIGIRLDLDDFDRIGSGIPLLVNLMPSGKFLMEDFYYAGGLPVVLHELRDHLNLDVLTVNGHTHRENITGQETCYNRDVIAAADKPLLPHAGIAVVKGNLATNGAVIKPCAATPALMQHRGRAVVFETIEDYHARVDDPALDIDETCVMVLKNVGPVGYPGMPEVGNMTLPKKLLENGVTDMVRISDGRMSGTAYGTVVLHVSPESAVGGTLALVQNGDWIELDVAGRRLHLDVPESELDHRRAAWRPSPPVADRGYVNLYIRHVQQADKGADLDFLNGGSGSGGYKGFALKNYMHLLIVFFGILLLVLMITWGKINAFLAFLVVSVTTGLLLGIAPHNIAAAVYKGMGDTLGELAIVIVLGAMLGKIVAESGAAQRIATFMMNAFGQKYIQWALMVTGFIIGIPLFYNVGFVLMVPLIFSVAYKYKLPIVYIGLPMLASLSVTHGFLPPHPAPAALVGLFHADMGKTLMLGMTIAIPAVILAGLLYSRTLRNLAASPLEGLVAAEKPEDNLPGIGTSLLSSLLPVILLMGTTVVNMAAHPDANSQHWLSFISNPSIILLFAVAFATYVLGIRTGMSIRKIMKVYEESVRDIAMILLIIGGSGALKEVFAASGVSREIAGHLQHWPVHPLVLGWLMAAIIRVCLGSATVAGLTAAGLILPIITRLHVNPNLMVLSVGAGSLFFSHVNDGGFWMFKEYFNLSIKDTIRSWSIMESIVSVVGLLGVLLLNLIVG